MNHCGGEGPNSFDSLSLLEQWVVETHAERRRTESPAYQEEVRREEAVLQGLLHKVRQLHP